MQHNDLITFNDDRVPNLESRNDRSIEEVVNIPDLESRNESPLEEVVNIPGRRKHRKKSTLRKIPTICYFVWFIANILFTIISISVATSSKGHNYVCDKDIVLGMDSAKYLCITSLVDLMMISLAIYQLLLWKLEFKGIRRYWLRSMQAPMILYTIFELCWYVIGFRIIYNYNYDNCHDYLTIFIILCLRLVLPRSIYSFYYFFG